MTMVATTGRWYSYLMMVGLLTFAENQGSSCPKPALSEKTTLVPLLSSVSLTCPGCAGQVSWIRHSQQVPSEKTASGHLVLNAVTYGDEDNYTCYRDGAPLCDVELLVKDELEKPEILCYLRHPADNITCEWKPTRNLHPLTKVTMTSWSITGTHTVSICSFINATKTFTCSSLYSEGDDGQHTLSLCATSRTDSQSSNTVKASMKDQVRPDPPVNVTVAAVEDQPRRLRVLWRCPQLWVDDFYHLEYQIQYRVENSQHLSNGTTMATSFVITDALMGRKHVIRVRAKEEFDKPWGSWSEEAVGTPWSDEKVRTRITLAPSVHYSVTSYQEKDPENDSKKSTAGVRAVPRYPWLLAGVSAGVVFLLFTLILLRQHEAKLLSFKERLLRTLFQSLPKIARAQPLPREGLTLPWEPHPTYVTASVPMLPDVD